METTNVADFGQEDSTAKDASDQGSAAAQRQDQDDSNHAAGAVTW